MKSLSTRHSEWQVPDECSRILEEKEMRQGSERQGGALAGSECELALETSETTTYADRAWAPAEVLGPWVGHKSSSIIPLLGRKGVNTDIDGGVPAWAKDWGDPCPSVMASLYFLSRLKPRWWWPWGEEMPRWLRRHCPILGEWGLKLIWTRDWRAKKLGFLGTFVCRRSCASCVSVTLKLTNSPPVRAPAWEGGAFVSRAIISPAVPAAYQRPTSKGELCTEHHGSGCFPTAEVNAVQTSTHSNRSCKTGRQAERVTCQMVNLLFASLPLNGMDSLPCPA